FSVIPSSEQTCLLPPASTTSSLLTVSLSYPSFVIAGPAHGGKIIIASCSQFSARHGDNALLLILCFDQWLTGCFHCYREGSRGPIHRLQGQAYLDRQRRL